MRLYRQLRGMGLFWLALILTACAPVYGSEEVSLTPLPTLAPTPLPDEYDLNGAENVARLYLEAWQAQDYATMHSLITFAARDRTPLDAFSALYEGVARDITLRNISAQPLALNRVQPSVAVLTYNLTFETLIVGTFTDPNRQLRMTLDSVDRDWRIAWTSGDIFAEMESGGALRLERTIPRRANIYDRGGNILADQNGRMATVQVVKANIPNPSSCPQALADALNEPLEDVQATLNRFGDTWLADVGVLEPSAYLEHEARLLRECAATFVAFNTRRYPEGALMPHIVGYVGYPSEAEIPALQEVGFNQDSILGRSGIELTWDSTLRGQPGGRLSIVQGETVVRVVAQSNPLPAQSVWLTVDSDFQRHVQGLLNTVYANAAERWAPRSKGATAIVSDVNTGEILVMVSYPTYDANAFLPFPTIGRAAADVTVQTVQENPRKPQLNRATQGTYPSGSVMKIATTLAALDSGVFEEETRYVCVGTWRREANFVRTDWFLPGHGAVTPRTGLAQSCNPFYYEAGWLMDGVDPFLLTGYLARFGLGQPTGMRDVLESAGLIADPDFVRTNYGLNWSVSRSVNYAIGQDIDITPLQIHQLTAMVARDGERLRPQLVLQTGLVGDAPTYTLQPELLNTVVLTDGAYRIVQEGMCDVLQERYGTAEFQYRNSRVAQYRPCGKTGTAQAPGEGELPHAWFTGYAPMDEPQIAVTVMVENAGEGSDVAAPIVRDIMDYYFFEYLPRQTFARSP